MSKILSFSVDDAFAKGFDSMIESSGYKNRSRFFRDAATQFSELKQRGELHSMNDDAVVEAISSCITSTPQSTGFSRFAILTH